MKRNIDRTRHFLVFFISALIFFSGMLLGLFFQSLRAEDLSSELNRQRQDYNSLILQYRYISELAQDENCAYLNDVFAQSLQDLNEKSGRLQQYDQQNKIKEADYMQLRKEYTMSQINYWLLARQVKKLCDSNYSIILYFFDKKENCPTCEDQGVYLDYVKRKLDDSVQIFALDVNEGGIIDLLKANYQVETTPTIIVDEEPLLFSTYKEIMAIICIDKEDDACQSFQNDTNAEPELTTI
ncbi:MAG: hypothetical protein ABIH41_03880 [Nanoarchaeota archaeon]